MDLLILILAAVIFIYFLYRTAKGKPLQLRQIPAVSAFPELVKRCTEMGRPVHFTTGRTGLTWGASSMFNISGFMIMGEIAKLCARYDVPLIVTYCAPESGPFAEDIMKSAYISEGKPDKPTDVRYLSASPRGYAAGVIGILEREKVGGNVLAGFFDSETLTFMETGVRLGAIQVGGTNATPQIPFMIACCDYVMITEEMFVAGAQLSGDPSLINGVVAEDFLKIFTWALVLIGLVFAVAGAGKSFANFLNM